MKRFWTLLFLSVLMPPVSSALAQQMNKNTSWYSNPSSDTVFIFVHGILSDSRGCWTSPKGVYWPELLKSDTRFGNPGIFLGGYYTDITSGVYNVADASEELLSRLRTKDESGNPPPLTKPKLIFIAHSTGGLVVRYLLEKNHHMFKDKNIGLVLLASPSRGSAWADRLEWLRKIYGNKMADQLSKDSEFMKDLDSRFADLIGQKKLPGLVGIDVFEKKFIVRNLFWLSSTHIVSSTESASYFGAPKIVPDSDHFSIAKPDSVTSYTHHLLWDFFDNRFQPSLLSGQPPGPRLKRPIFTEKVDKVLFSLGERGATIGYKTAEMEHHHNSPFNLFGYEPFKVYVENGSPFVDVKLYTLSGRDPMEIKHNELLNKPPQWDFNSNEKAMEIVDEKGVPLYQLYYKTPSHIVINGIFPIPTGFVIASDKGMQLVNSEPSNFHLRRIFKYPAWQFPGMFNDVLDQKESLEKQTARQPHLSTLLTGGNVFIPNELDLRDSFTGIALDAKIWNPGFPSVATAWSLVVIPENESPVTAQFAEIPDFLYAVGPINSAVIRASDSLATKTKYTPVHATPVEGTLLFYASFHPET